MSRVERGSAAVEFIAIVVVLIVPIAYAVVALAQLQSATYGVTGAAQMAARAYVQASSDLVGRYAAARSAAIAGRNHGLLITADDVRITCGQATCLAPGTAVHVEVRTTARIGLSAFAHAMPLRASHDVVVDDYRQAPL